MDDAQQLSEALAGRYDVEREIGRGGMATVYLARDVRHGRPVAIKLLDPELGAVLGVDRFLAEIKVTANLQHPNLLPLFDSGQITDPVTGKGGLLYYVMPYVEGESLRARLERERQLPVDEAVRYAIAIASALEYAHERGVIHRDLKPENILLQAGEPIVADFGIALAVSKAGGARVTQTGLSLGTPQYMSPEQATGDRVIDRRSDIYSLGAMLYEMLTGEPPHTGATMQAVIARLLTEQPRSVRSIRANVPEHVEEAIDRALEKLPADRWPSAREFAEALKGHAAAGVNTRATRARAGRSAYGWHVPLPSRLVVGLAAIAFTAAAFGVKMWSNARAPASPHETVRFAVTLPSEVQLAPTVSRTVDISHDGSNIAFIALGPTGGTQVYVRAIHDPVARPVPGTIGSIATYFSSDGKWLAFADGQHLKKVSLETGAVIQLAEVEGAFNGAGWGGRGELVIASREKKLSRVPENGGALQRICQEGIAGITSDQSPLILPDGETAIYSAWGAGGVASAKLAVASLTKGTCHLLDIVGIAPLGFVDDYLIYVTSAGVLTAVAFDVRNQRATAPPIPIVTDVAVFSNSGTAQAALSANGTLVAQGGSLSARLVVSDLSGVARALPAESRQYGYPRLSPDGGKIAVTVVASAQTEVWTYDMTSRALTKLTVGNFVNERPEWSADGARVLYRSSRGTQSSLWWRFADLRAPEEPLMTSDKDNYYEGVITPDGRYVVYQVDNGNSNVLYRNVGGTDTTSHPIAISGVTESQARVSPDGKWVAFVTTETGRDEVVVQPFPGPGARTQVSVDGAREPVWSRDGRRLFYRENQQFVAANVRTAPTFSVVSRDVLFRDRFLRGPYHANYDATPDGAHLLLLEAAEPAQLTIAYNWADEVRRRLRASAGGSR